MWRYLLLILAIVLTVVVVRLPARLLTDQLPAGPVQLLQPAGTLWNGRGRLLVNGEELGLLDWQLKALSLLTLKLDLTYALSGSALDLSGAAAVGTARELQVAIKGTIGNAVLRRQLSPYDIDVPGDLEVEALSLAIPIEGLPVKALDGSLRWAGGLVSYTLQNGTTRTQLPPLEAELKLDAERLPLAEVYSRGIDYPLLYASQKTDGFVEIGVTKRFTALAGMQWPGREADHETVLKVGEKLF